VIRALVRFVDTRSGTAPFLKKALRYLFPDHWSFLLGEVALYCFMLLVVTGIYLTFFFDDSISQTVYHGPYTPLQGATVSHAYASVLHISFGVKAGLLIRQTHHWAANVFLAAIVLHLLRVFFTGAFRKPRDLTYLLGLAMLGLSLLEGFAGYSLADDLLVLSREEAAEPAVEEVRLDSLARAVAETDPAVEALAPRPVTVRGDRAALERALANLVENAHRHGPAGGKIVVSASEDHGSAVLSVRDEGRGLQPDQSDRAFDRFWRADGGGPGSGLGLSIVRAIAERHGGRAFADGALFTIELPAVRDLSESAGTTGGRPPEKGTP